MAQARSMAASMLLLTFVVFLDYSEARSVGEKTKSDTDNSVSAVIPSPNQEFGDNIDESSYFKRISPQESARQPQQVTVAASNEATVPIYTSPFVRSQRSTKPIGVASNNLALHFEHQESSHAPPNYAPIPAPLAQPAASSSDLKTSASYGHHHGHHGGYDHGHHGGYDHGGYDHSGWLDMGAWTGGKGSFGWYADYPVGGKHGHGYGYGR